MSVNPTEPESMDELPEEENGFPEAPAEVPAEDAAEQRADLLPHHGTPPPGQEVEEADPADVQEQALAVEYDDDEYDR
ncbi:hypothetical protein GCM10009716_12760 [Streptomyces sodiiphilus]|uniref:DUF5709 domain-containing protein n=1 Tax=Streptomyces sodiiphilus TaxID=226217 RepID=A0ABP5A8E4_9ACTN